MTDSTLDLSRALFVKTALGQQEIQSRALGLNPLVRRLLILVDGKRSFQELGTFVAGHDLADLLGELQTKGCIEATVLAAPSAPSVRATAPQSSPAATPSEKGFASLPEASTRTAKEVDMARNFMMNTVNTVFQQNTRLTLMEAIAACNSVDDVRRVYPKWVETMSASSIGARRLPDFQEKLFKVL
jgi:hypothetical protein